MSHGARKWRFCEHDRVRASELAERLGIPRMAAHLLLLRGLETPESADRFLHPALEHLSDPFLLTDMREAIARIALARERGEHVLVFGDYDVDGITGTAILVNALRRYGIARCSYGMPHRLMEGYGLSPDRVQWAKEQGADLIVTVDNGVAAHDAVQAAHDLGIDTIVTDHHIIEGALPEAVAVVNPQREPPDHPAAELCGAGVAFKLAMALTGQTSDLDLAALGTVADIVPLRGENRVLVALGLREITKGRRTGLVALARQARFDLERARSENIAYQLAPRLNAGGRIGHAQAGVELLLTDSTEEANRIAQDLEAANEERRGIEATILKEATDILGREFRPEQRSIVLASPTWHAGVIGIVASRIQSRFYRPVVLIAMDEDGEGRGSARSIDAFDIGRAIEACGDLLVRYGGHRSAAGLTIRQERLAAFSEAFEAEAAKTIPEGELSPSLRIDAIASLSEIDPQLVATLELLQPFGHANPAPLFATCNVTPMPNSVREMGTGHMQCMFKEGPSLLRGIAFQMAERIPELAAASAVDIAYTPQFNTYRGETTLQLNIKDIRASLP